MNPTRWPKIEIFQDYMPVLETCKFEKVELKTEEASLNKVKYGLFQHSRASNSKTKCTVWPKFKLVRDFMPVLDTSQFKQMAIKCEGAMPWTRSNMGFFIWHKKPI